MSVFDPERSSGSFSLRPTACRAREKATAGSPEETYDERCPSGRKASFRHFRRLARHNRITVSLDVLVNLLAQHSTLLLAQHSTLAKVKA
jgi:hypothetical protein